ncbi:hypothetical protein ATANTOWER_024322, partial [Ataeniobius toweri]|nr:hypothetical protein [Ataeniobius toweri]
SQHFCIYKCIKENFNNQSATQPLHLSLRKPPEGEITVTMLKVALVLGCLLSLIMAKPMEHQRFARSSSGSNSDEGSNDQTEIISI